MIIRVLQKDRGQKQQSGIHVTSGKTPSRHYTLYYVHINSLSVMRQEYHKLNYAVYVLQRHRSCRDYYYY